MLLLLRRLLKSDSLEVGGEGVLIPDGCGRRRVGVGRGQPICRSRNCPLARSPGDEGMRWWGRGSRRARSQRWTLARPHIDGPRPRVVVVVVGGWCRANDVVAVCQRTGRPVTCRRRGRRSRGRTSRREIADRRARTGRMVC
jgi:hypothetical protein